MGPIILTSKLFGFGGIERFGRQITRAVSKHAKIKSQNIKIFTLVDHRKDIPDGAFSENVQVKGFGRKRLLFSISAALSALFSSGEIFVFHLHLAPIIYLVKLLRPQLRYGVHLHGIEAWLTLSGLRKKALQAADYITVSSRFTGDKAAEMNQLDQEKITVLYPTLGEDWIKRMKPLSPGQEYGSHANHSMLLTVARLEKAAKRKGIDLVIKALPDLMDRFPDLLYVIVGSGDDIPRLKTLARDLGLEDRIHFKGGISDEELANYFQTCSLFIMPSSTEGLGIVYLEAMAFAKPVISGEYGGSSEVVIPGETGFLVPYNDIPAIQKTISAILEDKEYALQLGEKGKKYLHEKFNPATMATSINNLLWNEN